MLCVFRRYPYLPHGRYWKFRGGREGGGGGGSHVTKFVKKSEQLNLEFSEGRGGGWGGGWSIQTKNIPWEGYGFFFFFFKKTHCGLKHMTILLFHDQSCSHIRPTF